MFRGLNQNSRPFHPRLAINWHLTIALNPSYLRALPGSELIVVWLRYFEEFVLLTGELRSASKSRDQKFSPFNPAGAADFAGPIRHAGSFLATPFPMRFWLQVQQNLDVASLFPQSPPSITCSWATFDSAHAPNQAFSSASRSSTSSTNCVLDKRFSGSNRFPRSHITLLPYCSSSQYHPPTMSCILDRKLSLVFLKFTSTSASS
ncbi:hypothetical protein B0J14DRAFT_77135 [Halenospora varia]|nr:hypothetical protein B0J14DRAFT_77135 [Halenospora varia]